MKHKTAAAMAALVAVAPAAAAMPCPEPNILYTSVHIHRAHFYAALEMQQSLIYLFASAAGRRAAVRFSYRAGDTLFLLAADVLVHEQDEEEHKVPARTTQPGTCTAM